VSLGLCDTWPRITSNYDMPFGKEACYDHPLTKIRYISSSFDLPRSMKDLKCHLFEVFRVCTTTKYAFSNNNRP
jgi:hypothetical protein